MAFLPKHPDSSLQQADMWDAQPISCLQGQLTCLMKRSSPQMKGSGSTPALSLLAAVVGSGMQSTTASMVAGPQTPPTATPGRPLRWPLLLVLAQALCNELGHRDASEELHHKLAFQIIGLCDPFHFCDEVLHRTIPKLSTEFGESGWRHPWGVEPYVAAHNVRGSHRCHMLSS